MVTSRYKSTFDRLLQPVARLLVRWHIAPSLVTLAGLVAVALSCLWVLRTRRIVTFCVLVILACLLDAVDGAVARASGRITKFGSYLDAVCDRYAEGAVVLTVAAVTGYWWLSGVVLLGMLLVSYSKARAAMEVPISNQEWPDLMERGERDVIFITGLALSQLVPWRPFDQDLFWWTLAILAVLLHLTVAQRMLRARAFIRLRSRG